jgi:DNA-binding NarL/FixJ family response regulator
MTEAHTTKSNTTILVVDDHPILRQGLTQLINQEADLRVCGEADEERTAIEAIAALKPDMVIVDIALKDTSGIELIKKIRASNERLPILVLSMHDESLYTERALRAGANGYIMKQEAPDQVVKAIRRVLAGEIYVSEQIGSRLLRKIVHGQPTTIDSPIDNLSDRELEVFRLIGRGYRTRQIAEMLRLSVKTVESYREHIKHKMGFRDATELLQHAIQWVQGEKPG